jgi:hypothetical protein
MQGGGHQYDYSGNVSIGRLWDLFEARMLRGCQARATFFPSGVSKEDDPSASRFEEVQYRDAEAQNKASLPSRRGFGYNLSRYGLTKAHPCIRGSTYRTELGKFRKYSPLHPKQTVRDACMGGKKATVCIGLLGTVGMTILRTIGDGL